MPPSSSSDRKSTRLNSSHTEIYTLSLHDALPIYLVLFYLFFEGGLIPMFLIIGVWGGPRRVYATFKFFLYTLLGSVLMLLAIMAMYWDAGTTDIPALLRSEEHTSELQS